MGCDPIRRPCKRDFVSTDIQERESYSKEFSFTSGFGKVVAMDVQKSAFAAMFIVIIGYSGLAMAQTPQVSSQPTSEPSQEQQSLRKPFTISPTGTIELPRGTTTVLKAVITEPPRGLRASTSGVSLNGYIGYVPYQGRNLMVTVVDSVTRGEHTVTIPRRIEAQEYRDKTVLSQQDKIKLEVDPADLDAALDQLAEMDKEQPQAKDQADKEQKPQIRT